MEIMKKLEVKVNGKTYWYYQAMERALTAHRKLINEFANPTVILNINTKIMEITIKQLRMQIDGLHKLTKGLNPVRLERTIKVEGEGFFSWTHSPDIDKAAESLILAKAWLGKCLGVIGTDSPYPKDGERHSVEDIEPTADTSELDEGGKMLYASNNKALVAGILTDEDWSKLNHIEKVDWLRQTIAIVLKEGKDTVEDSPLREQYTELPLMWYYMEAKTKLMVARFWLGFELERIRKANESVDTDKSMPELPKS